MKIRALTSFGSLVGSFTVGQEADVADEYATDWIRCGYAEPVGKPASEAAVMPETENAAMPKAKAKGKK